MSELPPRTCGTLGKYEKIAESQGDYLQANTVPRPNLIHTGKVTLKDNSLGVPSTYYPVNLNASAVKLSQNPSERSEHLVPEMEAPNKLKIECACKVDTAEARKEQCKENVYTLPNYIKSSLDVARPNMKYNMNTEENRKHRKDEHIAMNIQEPIQNVVDKPVKGILKNKAPCPCEHNPDKQVSLSPIIAETNFKEPINMTFNRKNEAAKKQEVDCYMPKPEDDFPDSKETEMGKLGPWATGRVDWSPLAGLTGIRPVVSKYSVARFSEGEWRRHNKELLENLASTQHQANLLEYNSKEALEMTRVSTDKNQADSTRLLFQREQEVHRWKCELERAISASSEEVANMQEERRRLKQAMAVLQLPESIAAECLERRTGRLDPELVRDEVEEELIKELALTAEIREQFTRTMADVEHQLLEDKTAKSRLEYDWSDKKQADDIECVNVALNDRSNILMFKPGAVCFPDHQSTQDYWEKFTRETLEESEITRQRSVALRGTLDDILISGAKNLRAQADRVDAALARRISCMEQIRMRLEDELLMLLKRLADIETTIINLRSMIRRMDIPLKKAQTRLDNKILQRPRIENCRDTAQYGLVDEVKTITESVAALNSQLKQAEDTQSQLMMTRSKLEREIMVKRKTLEIDRDRIKVIRSYYPSETAMEGH